MFKESFDQRYETFLMAGQSQFFQQVAGQGVGSWWTIWGRDPEKSSV